MPAASQRWILKGERVSLALYQATGATYAQNIQRCDFGCASNVNEFSGTTYRVPYAGGWQSRDMRSWLANIDLSNQAPMQRDWGLGMHACVKNKVVASGANNQAIRNRACLDTTLTTSNSRQHPINWYAKREGKKNPATGFTRDAYCYDTERNLLRRIHIRARQTQPCPSPSSLFCRTAS